MGRIVGIDLGTTNSVVAFWDGREAKVIPSRDGSPLTPSVVSFAKNGQVLVGQVARRQAVVHATTTVAHVKRIMGLTYLEARDPAAGLGLKVAAGPAGEALVVLGDREVSPEVISGHILESLRLSATAFLGEEVTQAVITVPAYFNDSQRQATRNAGKLAGLEVQRIINEPTAAALAYGLERQGERRLAVYDFGGGTFDVSVLQSGDGLLEVLATAGNTQLGGQDIDQRLVAWMLDQLEKSRGISLEPDPALLQRLFETAEQTKIDLSQRQEVDINLPFVALHEGLPVHLEAVARRPLMELMIGDLIDRTLICCDKALRDAARRPGVLSGQMSRGGEASLTVDEVLLVGGSSRIPRVQQAVRQYFGKEPRRTVNPDEVVAMGAAIQGALLDGKVEGITLSDVTPLSLGLERHDGTTSVLVPRNTPVPTRQVRTFSTADDYQAAVEIHVVQGEAALARDNRTLGRFALGNLAAGEAGDPEIEVTFSIDVDGLVHVQARDRVTGSFRAAKLDAKPEAAASAVPVPASAAARMRARAEAWPATGAPPKGTAAAEADRALRVAARVLETHGQELSGPIRRELEEAVSQLNDLSRRAVSRDELGRYCSRLDELTLRAVKSLLGRSR